MKSRFKILSLAAIFAVSLVACSRDNIENPNDNEGGTTVGEAVTVFFGAEAETPAQETVNVKVTLDPAENETVFKSAWENDDQVTLQYCLEGQDRKWAEATWKDSHFQAELDYSGKGKWTYNAVYPRPSDNSFEFGSNRTQNGNTYNSKYDLMLATASLSNSAAGKDDEGNEIKFLMKRKTALAYFHYTSSLDEKITSATLTVKDGTIACAKATIDSEDFANGFTFEDRTSSITITFEEDSAPSAKDFTLWFNVLPTDFTQAILEVCTSGHKARFNSAAGSYVAAHLYKVSTTIDDSKWEPLSGYMVNILDEYITGGIVTATPAAGEAGTKITLKATADEGYEFVSWRVLRTDNQQEVTVAEDNTFIMPASDVRVMAVFNKIVAKNYNVSLAPIQGGTISAKLPDNTDATEAAKGTIITLSLKYDAEEYKFEGWEVLNGSTPVEVTDNKFSMPEGDVTVSAILKKYFAVTLNQAEGGTISASESKAVEGTTINLSYTPAPGYSFDKWTITGAAVTLAGNSFLMPAGNVNVTAVFKKQESGSGGDDDDVTDLSNGGTAVANCYIVAPAAAEKKYKIPTSNSAGSVGAVTAAEVLWESFGTSTAPAAGDLVKDVNYAGDYITFTATGKAGNALIAAKNGDEIVWSWHIWITETNNITIGGTTLLDRNLGATSSAKGSVGALGLYYQWGRKDPFIGSSSTTTGTRAGISTSWPADQASNDETGNLEWANKHPMTYITRNNTTNTFHWFSVGADNKYNWITEEGGKTEYDPCPYGYMVPSTTSWPNLTNNSGYEDSTNHGVYVGDYWFPYAGFLANDNSSSLQSLSTELAFWLNDPSTKTTYIKNSFAGKDTNRTKYGSFACSVRCQKQ